MKHKLVIIAFLTFCIAMLTALLKFLASL